MGLRNLPVIARFAPQATSRQQRQVEELCGQIQASTPELKADEAFRQFVPERLIDAPALHLDDLSGVAFPGNLESLVGLQDRARLRAGTGDFVASCAPETIGYEDYAEQQLGLGQVSWLRPQKLKNPVNIATACWKDRHVRRDIIHQLRTSQLHYLHPHLGNFAVWELADLLHQGSRIPVEVIAPRPALCELVNNKVSFSKIVTELIGAEYVPHSSSAWSLSLLTERVFETLPNARRFCLKLPNSVGGKGNIVVDAESLRALTKKELQLRLQTLAAKLDWQGGTQLLVDRWETELLESPSVQTWIPPPIDGPPVIEGIFSQLIHNDEHGSFRGAVVSQLPADLQLSIADTSWLLASLFQQLGYIGRCSFDLLVLRESPGNCRFEFIECNGRWGGASIPMTLVNRLFGDQSRRPFAVKSWLIPGVSRFSFAALKQELSADIYDQRTQNGWLMLLNPARISERSEVTTLVIGDSVPQATARLKEIGELLKNLATSQARDDLDPSSLETR